jgi:outer membrane cobalamin receptor
MTIKRYVFWGALSFLVGVCFADSVKEDTSLYVLEEVIVKADRRLTLSLSPLDVSLLTEREINWRNVYTPTEMLEIAPNTSVERTTKGAFKCIALRGFSASDNLVLYDGIPMNTGFANWANLMSFPANEIGRIEVVQGPNSIVYGPNAIGGVINLLSKKETGGFSLDGQIRSGDRGFRRYMASFSGGKKANYRLSVSRDESDGYLPNTDYRGMNIGGELSFRFKGYNLRFNGGFLDFDAGVPIDPKAPQRIEDWRGRRGSFVMEGNPYAFWTTSIKAYANFESYRIKIFKDTTFSELKKDLLNDGKTLGGEFLNNFLISTDKLLSLGIQWERHLVDFAYVGGRREINLYGAFLQGVFTGIRDFAVTVGIRGDRHSISGDKADFSLGVTYTPKRGKKLRFSLGTASRYPAIRELYMTSPAPGRGDSTLQMERSYSVETGFDLSLGGTKWLKVNFFYTRAKNLIERDLSVSPWVFSNIGSARMQGLEVEVSSEGEFGYFFNLSLLDAKDLNEDKPLNFRPNLRANLGLQYGIAGSKVFLTGRFVGEQHYTAYNPETESSEDRILKDYYLVDLKLTYPLLSMLELSLAVDNLLDRDYYVEGHQQATPIIEGEPRRVTLGIDIKKSI